MSMKSFTRLAMFAALSLTLSGCSRSVTVTVGTPGLPAAQLQRDESGAIKTADTPSNFQRWKSLIDIYVQYEAQGRLPPNPNETWKSYWDRNFQMMRERQINPEKYIQYVIAARRANGLPGL